jgi:hypothetical protein
VGAHAADLQREAEELAIRKAQESASGGTGGSASGGSGPGGHAPQGGGTPKGKVPTVEELAGSDGLEALKHKDGRVSDGDSLAQSMGYKDWNHYMEVFEATKEEGEKMGIGTS